MLGALASLPSSPLFFSLPFCDFFKEWGLRPVARYPPHNKIFCLARDEVALKIFIADLNTIIPNKFLDFSSKLWITIKNQNLAQ